MNLPDDRAVGGAAVERGTPWMYGGAHPSSGNIEINRMQERQTSHGRSRPRAYDFWAVGQLYSCRPQLFLFPVAAHSGKGGLLLAAHLPAAPMLCSHGQCKPHLRAAGRYVPCDACCCAQAG